MDCNTKYFMRIFNTRNDHMNIKYQLLLSLINLIVIYKISYADDNPIPVIPVKATEYVLDLSVDYKTEKITGVCRLTVHNITENDVDHIPLLLYRVMHVTSVTDEDGNDMQFTQSVKSFTDWDKMQVNEINVYPGEPLLSGEEITIKIEYSGYLFGYAETGMAYIKDSVREDFTIIRMDSFAYPIVGYPMWRALRAAGFPSYNYEINVTVPSRFTVANGGEYITKTQHNGTVTYSYRNIKPAWRMDIAIAEYEVLDRSDLRVFYFPEDREGAQRVMTEMEYAIGLFTGWFGPLHDYLGFTVIQIPESYGSQADVTSIIQTADAFHDEGNIVELYHELSHLWNVRDNDTFSPRWNEGLAMFLQYLVLEKRQQKDDIVTKGAERLRRSFRRQYSQFSGAPTTPMIDYGKAGLTNLSYNKGMLFFYVHYHVVGEEEFLNTIGNHYQRYVQNGITTEEFLDYLIRSASVDISKFVHDWFYTKEIDEKILEETPLEDLVLMYRE
jgi:hypothetical protein